MDIINIKTINIDIINMDIINMKTMNDARIHVYTNSSAALLLILYMHELHSVLI